MSTNSQSRTLDQWLSVIEAAHPAEIELGLERVRAVAEKLALIDGWNCPIVTLAGTNGKGSTQAFMRSICTEQGYQVGCYSSPHFLRYNERVTLNGEPADDQSLCQAFDAIDQARESLGLSLSYFEVGTLAALWLFRQWQPDLILLEVGLGGRLDAVNIIDPDVAVITTVALDHQDWLGNDRETVGFEKAGILRPGIPMVYGEVSMPDSVRQRATELGCTIHHWGEQFGPRDGVENWSWYGLNVTGEQQEYPCLPSVRLPFENASTALQALALLPLSFSPFAIVQGLKQASLTGRRQQLVVDGRELLLDVAHNPHAAHYLASTLPPIDGQSFCVLGMLADKDCSETISELLPLVDHWLLAGLSGPRGLSADALQEALPEKARADALRFDTPWQACQAALRQSNRGDRILVLGSFHTVADILAQLQP
ncbi:bifunctional tetrahydrofolate synthase/dihydrofolate synthase [Motiliproteus coralliicola]|uniref:Dihydrofolate synthase/folylpolyglutamate synthase n=1 Tax=Motiliproteus coralliicola TaxID=2283196 RepID=A0A369WTK5_9GAMM|nr:bifunctional tetrahydrofolate synthase/dihydrofolate synthase [Motiliproteus coralliicola]RDE24473.1 bifunctional tetrahydrofolate synthase/dihydrofolate synthase [Motiliproteus coralliicola]